MKAVRYYGPTEPLRLVELEQPEPGSGEVVVRVHASGVCGTELHFLSGLLNLGVAPITLGHEVAGVVHEVGQGVDSRWLGQRVVVYYYVGCRDCVNCSQGYENLCTNVKAQYGFVSDGGFAEFIKVPTNNLVPLPPNISDDDAAPIGCAVTTALHAGRLASIGPDDHILIYGVGAVGYGLVQLGRMLGATVIGVGRTQNKLQQAKDLGAHFVINSNEGSVVDQVLEITDGRGADAVFELVATSETMENSIKSLGKRGRLVFIGYSSDYLNVHPIQLVVNETSVMGSVGNTLDELREAVRLVSEGKIQTVVDRTLQLEQFQEGVDALLAGTLLGRVVLKP